MPLPHFNNTKISKSLTGEPIYLNLYEVHIEDTDVPEDLKKYIVNNTIQVDISKKLKLDINGCDEQFANMLNFLPLLKNIRLVRHNKKGEIVTHIIMEVKFSKTQMIFKYDDYDTNGFASVYDNTLNPGYDYDIVEMKAYDNQSYEAYKRSTKLNKIDEQN